MRQRPQGDCGAADGCRIQRPAQAAACGHSNAPAGPHGRCYVGGFAPSLCPATRLLRSLVLSLPGGNPAAHALRLSLKHGAGAACRSGKPSAWGQDQMLARATSTICKRARRPCTAQQRLGTRTSSSSWWRPAPMLTYRRRSSCAHLPTSPPYMVRRLPLLPFFPPAASATLVLAPRMHPVGPVTLVRARAARPRWPHPGSPRGRPRPLYCSTARTWGRHVH